MKSIYLAGPIDGLAQDDAQSWRKRCKNILNHKFKIYSPEAMDNRKEVWVRDYYMLDGSDIILVNLDYAGGRPFIGTSLEIGRAFYQRKPIIVFSTFQWVHSDETLQYHATKILNTLDEAIEYIQLYYN